MKFLTSFFCIGKLNNTVSWKEKRFQLKKSKSCDHSLEKTLIFTLIVVMLPMFWHPYRSQGCKACRQNRRVANVRPLVLCDGHQSPCRSINKLCSLANGFTNRTYIWSFISYYEDDYWLLNCGNMRPYTTKSFADVQFCIGFEKLLIKLRG